MHTDNPNNAIDNPTEQFRREPHEIINDIQQGGDQFMAAVQELIEWTDYDIAQLCDYLKRIGNFIHAVIEAHPKTYTLEYLTHKLEVDEPTLRRLLHDVGAEIDADIRNLNETVSEPELISLLADRAGSRIGDRLAELLRGEGPYLTWR